MTRIETLKSLQARIREATGADRELDAQIALALGIIERFDEKWDDGKYDYGGYRRPGQTREFIAWSFTWPYSPVYPAPTPKWEAWSAVAEELQIPNYTTDPDGLGACVALMHAVLSVVWVRTDDGIVAKKLVAILCNPTPNTPTSGNGETLCLAYLDAICAARIAELEAEQEKERVGS